MNFDFGIPVSAVVLEDAEKARLAKEVARLRKEMTLLRRERNELRSLLSLLSDAVERATGELPQCKMPQSKLWLFAGKYGED